MELRRFHQIFLNALKGPLVELLDLFKEAEVSFQMDQSPVQDSFRYRAKYLGLKMASLLIDDSGELNRDRLETLNRLFEPTPFILGPRREGDAMIYHHLKNCLLLLKEKEIWDQIRKFSLPLCHKRAEEIIKETLWPEQFRSVQTVHIRKAAVAAWFTLLRQMTGSCFATAPAILIQQQAPIQFFKDLYDLLSTGQLKRVVAGKEYAVPLTLSSGTGDLQRVFPFPETSPGIRAALEDVGIPWSPLLLQRIREKRSQSIEKLFRSLLLESMGLTEEDLESEEHLSKIQMTPLLARQMAVYYQKPSERAQKVSDWKRKLAKACSSFQSFTECALLRIWEYTIASFCDVKNDFSKWNLYVGLGMDPDQKGGVGAFLYGEINEHLQQCNREIAQLTGEYEQEMGAMQAIEAMIQSSASEARRNQLKSEWVSHNFTLSSIRDLRNQKIQKAEELVGFFSSLLRQYDQKLQEYFQELFDPALLGEETHLYDDSPAGFRLVYKHGRRDASQWTAIHSGEQYIDCLCSFFSAVENDLNTLSLDKEYISKLTTALIQFIQEPEFLSSALLRSQKAGKRSPWDYVSGGTMQTLLLAYENRDKPFTESKMIPHSEEELLRFLIREKQKGALLIHSPTHAFIFYPELLPENSESFIEENRKFVRRENWDESMQEHLAHRVSERLAEEERALFLHLHRQTSTAETNRQFRAQLIEALGPRIKNPAAIVDSVLYEQTPLFSLKKTKQAVDEILSSLGRGERVAALEGSFFGCYDLYQITKGILLEANLKVVSPIDWDFKIAEAMRHLGFSQPHLCLFADTNWSAWFFGFVANPATGALELWRLNRNGMQGFPMTNWKEWMNQTNSAPWILLSKPIEYVKQLKL